MDTAFLKSTRFWVMIVGALSMYAFNKGFIGDAEVKLIETIAALFIGIRTIDRFGENTSTK